MNKITRAEFKTIEKEIKEEMREAAREAVGCDEWDGETICYVMRDENKLIGAIVVDIIYGQMRIDYLMVRKQYRYQGFGTKLLLKAFDLAKERDCTFAYLETLNFQAPQFYEKNGFILEYSRAGYAHNIVFNYYKKNFNEDN